MPKNTDLSSDTTWTHLGLPGSQSQAFFPLFILVIVPSIGASSSELRMSSIVSHVTLAGQPQASGHILDKTPRTVHSKIKDFKYLLICSE